MITKDQARIQLRGLHRTGFDRRLETQAVSHGLPVPYLFAIASRESNCANVLGDFIGGVPHGVGIVQVDVQHPIARIARDTGSWETDPDPLIAFGAQVLKDNIASVVRKMPGASPAQRLKAAASGYNCGMTNALRGFLDAGDTDRFTTGRDYGRDVMMRMQFFAALLAEEAGVPA